MVSWEPENIEVVIGDSAEMDRRVAELYFKGMSHAEIGKELGIAGSSAGRRLAKMFKSGEIPRRSR
jgi:DNA-binding transcriptional regulator LsrR (DeoR family)